MGMREGRGIKLWAVAVWLIVWEVAARLLNKEIFLVSPIKAIARFAELAITGNFWVSVLGSFGRIAVGFLLAVAAGVILAALSAKYKRVRELFGPVMLAIRTVPIASFIILALICFSSKYLAILISFMIVLPTIYENVFTGIEETDKSILEMGKVFNVPGSKIRRYIYWPEVYPYFRSACKTAVGMAWKAGVAAEVIGAPKGSIGAMLHQAKIYLETADLLAWTIGIVLLSLFMEKILLLVLTGVNSSFRKLPATGGMRTADAKIATDITLKNISKAYYGQQVLKNINFVFPGGAISAIRGLSGAGKTTLMRIIAGIEKPDEGTIDYTAASSVETAQQSENAAVGHSAPPRVAVVFQEDRLLDYMTAEENIRFANENLSAEEVRLAMKAVGLNESTKPVGEYSGGMKRRVAILRALLALGGNTILLLDEAFKGLDAETKKLTMDFIKERADGATVILVTHDRDEADAMGTEHFLYL